MALPRWVAPVALVAGAAALFWPRESTARPRKSQPKLFTKESLIDQSYTEEIAGRAMAAQAAISKYSTEFDVDPALVAAVIRCESGFRPAIQSKAGATGMMQIMPKTGVGWAGELGIEGSLTNPSFNIRLGSYGLSKLLRKWDGDVERALASYNWGIGNVKKSPDGPYPKETQGYIKCVKAHRKRFRRAMTASSPAVA